VGGIILALTVLLWFLLSFPAAPADATMPAIDYSFAGRIGHAMAAVFAPLGFNWQICIALIPGWRRAKSRCPRWPRSTRCRPSTTRPPRRR
jgi:Fe2+ transport system protein B